MIDKSKIVILSKKQIEELIKAGHIEKQGDKYFVIEGVTKGLEVLESKQIPTIK